MKLSCRTGNPRARHRETLNQLCASEQATCREVYDAKAPPRLHRPGRKFYERMTALPCTVNPREECIGKTQNRTSSSWIFGSAARLLSAFRLGARRTARNAISFTAQGVPPIHRYLGSTSVGNKSHLIHPTPAIIPHALLSTLSI